MKNTKRFMTAWLMLSSLLGLAVINIAKAETNVQADPQVQAEQQKKQLQAGDASAEMPAKDIVQQTEDHIARHSVFLDKELMKLYRQDEMEITYYFMDVVFPQLMASCAEQQQQRFNVLYPGWQQRHEKPISSGRSIIQGRFKGEDAEHLEQTIFFTLQQLKQQSEDFQLTLCKEVVRMVTPVDERNN